MGALSGPQGEPFSQLGHQGRTPLYIAAQQGHGEVVQQLITAGPLEGGLEDLPSEGRKGATLSGPPLMDRESWGKGGNPRIGGSERQEKSVQTLFGTVPTRSQLQYTEDLQIDVSCVD